MPLDTSAPGFGRTDVGRALRTLAGAGPPDGSHLGRGKVGDDVMGALKEFSTDKTQSQRRLSGKRASEGEGPSEGDPTNEAEASLPETPPSPIRASRKDSVPKSTRARLLADSDDGEDAPGKKTSQGVKSKKGPTDQDADARVSVSDESPDPLERSTPEDNESEEKEKDGAANTHDMSTSSRPSLEAGSKPAEDEEVRKSSQEDSEAHEEEHQEEVVSRAPSQEAEAEALVSSATKTERTSTRSSEEKGDSKATGHGDVEEAPEDEELHASQDDEVVAEKKRRPKDEAEAEKRDSEVSRSRERGSTPSVSSQRPSRKDFHNSIADEPSYRRQNSRYFDDEPEPVQATSERDRDQTRSRKESVEKLEKRQSSVGSVDSLKDIPQKMVNHGGGPATSSKKSSKEVTRGSRKDGAAPERRQSESEGKSSRQDLSRKKSHDEDSGRRASDQPEVTDGTPPQSRRSSARSQQNTSVHEEEVARQGSDVSDAADATPPQSRRSSRSHRKDSSLQEEVARQGSDVSEAADATPPRSRVSSRSKPKTSQKKEVARQGSDVSDAADATPPQSRVSSRSHSKTSQKKEVARQVSDVSEAADAAPPQSRRSPRSSPKTSQKKEVAGQVSDVSEAADATPPQLRRSARSSPKTSQKKEVAGQVSDVSEAADATPPRSSPKTSQKKEVARQVSDVSEAADATPPQSRRSSSKTSQKKEAAREIGSVSEDADEGPPPQSQRSSRSYRRSSQDEEVARRVSDISEAVDVTPPQSQRSSRSHRRTSEDEEAARQVSDVSEAVDATPPQSQRSSRSYRRASQDEEVARQVSDVSEAIGTTPPPSRRLSSDTKMPTSSSRKQEKPLDSRRNLAKQSTKERLSKVDRSKSPKGSKMSTVMAPVPATTPSAPNLATARRSKQRSSIAEERTMARSNSRKELKDRKTSHAPEKVQVPEQLETRPDKEQTMQTPPEAGPCRISRWARARPAPEAVEAAEVAPAVPGRVEEDALVAAQLYSSPPPPPPDGGAFYWPPPPPVALEMPTTSYWPPPPPDVNFNPCEAWDARLAPSPLTMATCGVSPLGTSLGPMSPLSNHEDMSVVPPWHLGDERREMQRQELMMLQQQQQIFAFPPSLHGQPQDNASQVSPPPPSPPSPPSPTKLSPRRVDEATGSAHRLAHRVLTHGPTSTSGPIAASPLAPAVPQGAARQMAPPSAPVPAAKAGGYPRSRELAEQKRQLEACQSTNRPMASQLHRQMRALQEQQQRLLQRNATAATSPRRTAAQNRSASPIRSVSPLQQPGYTRAVSPETSVSRLHQPRVVARPAAHVSATVVTGTRAQAAQGMPLEPTTMRRMDQAAVRSPSRNGVATSPRSRSATPRVESGPVRRVQSQTPPSPSKGNPARSLPRSRSATPTPAPVRTVSPPARSKTPPKDPLAFKARRTPDTEKTTSTPRDVSPTPTSRLPRKPAVPSAAVVKAKSEKNLSSFLPDSKPMGFADKVTTALAKPASPRSDGKENVYLGFRNGHGQRDGFGVMQVENGPTYTGQWSGSKREGHGTLFFDKGVFEGQWIQGNAHGKGIVHFKNGDTFQGNYQQNRKCGFGTYTWADGTVESGDYLEGQKHGQHQWRRGDERWEMFYHQGALVATKRREEVEAARKTSAKSAEAPKSSDQKGKKEFVAQKLAMDKARPAPKPTPPPSPPSEQRATVPPSTSTSSRCRSNSAFRAQGFTDEEIALMERKSPPSSPTHPLPDRAAQPGGSSARVFFPTSARARPASTAVAAPGKGLPPSTNVQRVVPTSAVPVAARAASSSSSMVPAQAAPAADAAAGAGPVEPPPEPKPPDPAEAPEPEVDSEEEEEASEEPSTPGVHDG